MRISIFSQRSVGQSPESQMEVKEAILDIIKDNNTGSIVFLVGGAKGAQQVIKDYLKDDFDFVTFKPWTRISKRLESMLTKDGQIDPTIFFYRNIQIVDESDLVVIMDNDERDAEVYKVLDLCKRKNKEYIHIKMEEK